MANEELLQRRLTRARVALAALGLVAAVCVRAVGVTIWHRLSYLRGPSDTAFTRGPYLLSGSEAALRRRVRCGKAVRLTAVGPDGAPVAVGQGVLRGLAPDTRHAWAASVEAVAQAAGSFTPPPRTLDRPVRFAVFGDYGSGNDDEGAVGRVLAAQRPEWHRDCGRQLLPRGGRAPARPQHLPPLADLIGSAPMVVCLGDHDNFWPGRGAIASAFDIPEGGRYSAHYGRIQVVVLRDEPNRRRRVRADGPARAGAGGAL